jgi:hypothetical protein
VEELRLGLSRGTFHCRIEPDFYNNSSTAEFDVVLRHTFSESWLTDRGMQNILLPITLEGGGFKDIGGTICAGNTVKILDTAEHRSVLPGHGTAASLNGQTLSAYATNSPRTGSTAKLN